MLLFLPYVLPNVMTATEIYVATKGKNSNPGTREAPLATLDAARRLIASRQLAGQQPVTVYVADGVYYLPKTLIFTASDSGSEDFPIVYRAQNEGQAILSGGTQLSLDWSAYRDGIYKADTPKGLLIDQLFVDGQNQRMARYPNYDPQKKAEPYQGFAADAFSKTRAAKWADPAGGYIHAMHRAGWGGYHYRISGKNDQGAVTYEGGWQNNRRMGMHPDHRMVENIFEELDAPGEWYHDAKTSTLYFKPSSDTDLSQATIEVVRLRHLIEFNGSEKSPVKFITLQGFKLRHAARTFMDCKEQLLRSDWAIYRGGALMVTGTEDVSILDCEFDQLGGNAVFVNNYNRRVRVKGCHIHDSGASGVCFVGDPNAVRDPLFEYRQKNDLAKVDRTPGPKTNNYPAQCFVEDCLIHGIGRVERQPAGVQITMASEITVRDCSIYDTARAGINIGDGAWGGHLIERCDVFDTVLETHDHGSFNSWGRDRYWRSDHLTASQKAVDAEPDLPFLDAVKTTIIRNSRWRCDHGWDIDLDDGSSNYDIYNNLMLNRGLKLREGFRRHAWNNLMPVGSLHPHVWFQRSQDQVYANIMAERHRTARMNEPYVDKTMVDHNLFSSTDQGILAQAAKLGWDKHSLLADPMYRNPAQGDFRVKEGSPALKLGFKNFPMDQFGVKKPSLKAIAKTPEIPSLQKQAVTRGRQKGTPLSPASSLKKVWLGASLKDLQGEEFSAYGVSQEAGGVVLEKVPAGSTAADAGLKTGDLIQVVHKKPVSNTEQLFNVLSKFHSDSLNLKVIRNQQPIVLTVKMKSIVVIETVANPSAFTKLPLPKSSRRTVTANQLTNNQPLDTLTDGKLAENYGPVFSNSVVNGAYKMDLGKLQNVSSITGWSYNQNGRRGAQYWTVYGSNSKLDPGWDLGKFTAIGTVVSGPVEGKFTAASLRARDQKSLGKYRWIVWTVIPVSDLGGGENTAFQELAVNVVGAEQELGTRDLKTPSEFPGNRTSFTGSTYITLALTTGLMEKQSSIATGRVFDLDGQRK